MKSEAWQRGTGLVLAAIVAVTVVAYWPSLSVPFQFDDYARISGNPQLQRGDWLRGIGQLGGSRVVPATTLAFNYWLSGEDTTSYHVVNLVVHVLACLVVFRLAWLLAATPRLRGNVEPRQRLFFAGCAAAVFACHPLQTQAVTYIVQRFASMAALFYVAAVCAYLSGRLAQVEGRSSGRLHFAAAAGMALAALLSKENAISLPLAIGLIEYAGFGWRGMRSLLRAGAWALPLFALPFVWKVLAWRARPGSDVDAGLLRQLIDAVSARGPDFQAGLTPIDYFLTQMLVLPRYLGLVVAPVGLNVDHDVAVASSLGTEVAAGVLFLFALLLFGCWALRTASLFGFSIVWFFVALSVESSVVPIHDVMMEHRMYLAMPGVAVGVAALLLRLRAIHPSGAASVAVATVAVLAVLTFSRNQVWQSALSLWSDAAAKSPGKARVHINAGVAHHARDQLDEAIAAYCTALRIDPEIPVARNNIEIAVEQQGRLEELMPRRERRVRGASRWQRDLSDLVCAQAANGKKKGEVSPRLPE